MDLGFPHLCKDLTFCPRALVLCVHSADIWAHLLGCLCLFFLLILEQPPHPCGKCIAPARSVLFTS